MSVPFSIIGAGMLSGVGLSASASCAAIRGGIKNFAETRFVSSEGDNIIGSEVPFEELWRGLPRLAKLSASAIRDCSATSPQLPEQYAQMPLILCLAEDERPGRLPGLDGTLLQDIEKEAGLIPHPHSCVIAQGRVGGVVALRRAQKLMEEHHHPYITLVGVDTYLIGPTLSAFERRHRLLTRSNSNGFIPGEAAVAVLLARSERHAETALDCRGLGFARESATIESDAPLRGDGMVSAIRGALASAGINLEQVDYRISDINGEQYRFKEVALATNRILRGRKVRFGIWHPADCIGEVGAAALPAMLCVLYYGARKRYLPGPTFLACVSNDDDKRATVILTARVRSDGK
jgi:3-oxoacyl-[acyl-carrier-protein] synthase I